MFKHHRKKIIITLLITFMLVYPNYFFGAIGILLAIVVIGLFVADIVLDVYIVWAYFSEWYREKYKRK